MPARFAVLAFGPRHEIHARTAWALLAIAVHAPPGAAVAVYTDRPELYRWLAGAVTVRAVGADELRAWKGPQDFFFRVKIMALRDLIAAGADPAVLVDGDTAARLPLAELLTRLVAEGPCMHVFEQDLSTTRRRNDRRIWAALRGRTVGGLVLDGQAPMWNAGVVGLAGPGRGETIARILAVADDLLAAIPGLWTAEQFAFSLVLSRHGGLFAAEPWFAHYYDNKAAWDHAIDRRLAGLLLSGGGAAEALALVRDDPIALPVQVRIRRWQRLALRAAGLAHLAP